MSQKWLKKCQKTQFDFDNEDSPAGGSQPPSRTGSDGGSENGSDDVFEATEDNEKRVWKLSDDEIIEIEEKPKVIPTEMKEIQKVREDPSIKEVIDTYVPSNNRSPNGYAKLNGATNQLNGILKTAPIHRQVITDYMYKPKAYHWIHKETQV